MVEFIKNSQTIHVKANKFTCLSDSFVLDQIFDDPIYPSLIHSYETKSIL